MKPLRLRYQTIEIGPVDIHLRTLRDNQQFHDPEGIAEAKGISSATWPLFGIVWPSGLVLAHKMREHDTENKRILEIGCGIGLTSLMLNKQKADITATDYHPEAEKFLIENASLNEGETIAFECADWNNEDDTLGQFDLIVGSDLLYEDEHILLLANFIEQHAKPDCEVVIVDPGRGRKNKFSKAMATHGFTYEHYSPEDPDYLSAPFKGKILHFLRHSKANTTAS